MPTVLTLDQEPQQLPATAEDPATIHNSSGGTVFYGVERDRPDSQLNPGEKIEVEHPQWVRASATDPAKVVVLRNADRPKVQSVE